MIFAVLLGATLVVAHPNARVDHHAMTTNHLLSLILLLFVPSLDDCADDA